MGIQINGQTDTVTATDGSINIGGNVTVPGVLTYEDVTSVDAVGLSTFQNGIHVTGGSVGIGTDNPGAKTHIDSTTSNTPLVVEASQNNRSRLVFRNNQETGTQCTIELIDEDLRFNTNSGERMRIVRDGNIGIGITNPQGKLEIAGNASSTTQFSGFNGLRIHNTNGAAFGVSADMYFTAGTLTSNRGAAIGVQYESGAGGNDLYFATNPGAVTSSDTLHERLRITSAGQLRSQATYDGSATTSNTFPCLNLNNLQGSYTANNFIGGVTFGKAPGHGNGIRAGMLALYASTGSIADNIGTQLSFRTSAENGGDGKERLRITSTGAVGIGSDFTAIETAGGGGITLDSGVGGGNIGVFLKSTGYTGNQTKLWQDSTNAVSYLESTERPLWIKAGDGAGDYIRMDVAGSERLLIDDEGSIIHKTSSAVDNTEGSNSANSNYHARGASFNKIVSVNNGSTVVGQCMNMISHTKSVTLNGSTDHDMIMIGNREGCFIGHIYAGYSTSGDGAVVMYKFHTFYGARTLTAEISPQSRSSDTISVDMTGGASGDQHIIRVNGNGYSGPVTVGVVFLSVGTVGAAHFTVRYY